MATRKKNSLVENINRRKRAGKSRSKAKSTVSKEAYEDMQQGWPGRGRSATKKSPGRKRATKRRTSKQARKSGAKRKSARR